MALGRGPGSLPVARLQLLEAGIQPGAEEVPGEAGHAGGVLGVRGGLGGDGPGLGRPYVSSLEQEG